MDYKEIIDKLVRELSYRVGVPNIHNKEHQSIMSEILSEWGEYDIKETIFNHLNEDDKKFKNPIQKNSDFHQICLRRTQFSFLANKFQQ